MSTENDQIVGRLAPSPTGALHLGNARSFLLAWLSVRSRGGRIILRIEDLDHPKVKPWTVAEAIEDLRWLGLDWDEGPDVGEQSESYIQSKRIGFYREALARLIAQGRVYPCTCSRRDVEAAQSAPHAENKSPRYTGVCRDRYSSYEAAVDALGGDRLPAWRFRVDASDIVSFHDEFCGRQQTNVYEQDGDFVIARHPDGAGYNLAVVVDDALMGVNEVVRGDDLIDATFRHKLVYEALGYPLPRYIHLPLVVSPEGRRLAKRHGDTRIASLRARGVPAERVVGVLAWWSGLVPFGESCKPSDLLRPYDLSRIPKDPVVLDGPIKAYLGIDS